MRITGLAAPAIVIGLLSLSYACNATSPTGATTSTGKTYPPVPSLPVMHCTEVVCRVNVEIVLALAADFKCDINVDPPILDLRGGPAVQRIEWIITSPASGKWPDPTDPYLPVQFERDAQHVISNPSVSGDLVAVTYTRPRAGGHHYGYGLSTKHPTLGKFCEVAPWVLD
jgi:hypothetical protein